MCGIAGLLAGSGAPDPDLLRRMAGAIIHRGPDDDGVWIDPEAGIGFGHRRLAILDLSPLGHQPMASQSGRYVISYNGEIYNHLALRVELEGVGKSNQHLQQELNQMRLKNSSINDSIQHSLD